MSFVSPGIDVQLVPAESQRTWLIWVLAVVVLLAGAGWFGWRIHARRRAQQNAERNANAATIAASQPALGEASGATNSPTPEGQDAVRAGTPVPDLPPSPTIDGSLELKIDSDRATPVVIEADGLPLFNGEVDPGESRIFYAQTDFQVSARNGGALRLMLNGQTLPSIGPSGKPGKVTLTRRDLKAAGGTH